MFLFFIGPICVKHFYFAFKEKNKQENLCCCYYWLPYDEESIDMSPYMTLHVMYIYIKNIYIYTSVQSYAILN